MALNGIDVSGYQPTNITALVPLDFAIMKATEGTGYTSKSCDPQLQTARKRGALVGVYHFATRGDANAQADYFVNAIRGYIGTAALFLDWEATAVAQGPAWAKTWLDRVHALTGVRPGIYMSASVVNAYDWSAVAKDYPLWLASYGANPVRSGYSQPAAPAVRHWGRPLLFQYGSQGRLPGYGANLDVDVFYGDSAAWRSLAAKGSAAVKPSTPSAPAKPAASTTIAVDGVWGAATTRRLQQVLGVTADGILGPQTYRALQKRIGVTADGIWGPASKRGLQRHLGVAADGIIGPRTVKALQTRLNRGTV